MKFINRLIFHYQIPVAQTASVQETAELIQALVEQWKEDPASLKRTNELVKVTDGIHIQKKANAADYKQFGISCLAQCPGVSVKMAEALIEAFGSLKGVIDAPVKDIENVKVGARKVGPVVSKRLSEILNMP
jgi:ERCC4-type nuclease